MHDDGHFDESVAATYDDSPMSDPEITGPAAAFLAGLSGDGRALEFAIGTGRIALPLARRGVEVHGIELSRAMVARLREKEGGREIPVTIGDMASTRVKGCFSLVYLVFNTISNLTTQDAQVDCFRNAASHLKAGGRFVVEVGVPPLQRLPPGQTLVAFDRSGTHWGIDEFDVVTQRFASHHVTFDGDGCRRLSVPFRYAWPAEFDLMARLAGLTPDGRWAGWRREPFTSLSESHVSVWRKPA